MDPIITRSGISPVGGSTYRLNRLRFHLLAYAIALKGKLHDDVNGTFIIRSDDTDKTKVVPEYMDAYMQTLSSIGVVPDYSPYTGDAIGNPLKQSERSRLYDHYFDLLQSQGLVEYHKTGSCLFNVEAFYNKYKEFLSDYFLTVEDVSLGTVYLDIRKTEQTSTGNKSIFASFPIKRKDGTYLFNFTSPVDDGALGVTHIVRNTGKLDLLAMQEMIRVALGFPKFKYVHTNLLVNRNNKRFIYDSVLGEATFENLVNQGYLPDAIVSYLLSGFFGPSEQYYESITSFSSVLDLRKIHRNNCVFSLSVLDNHQKKAISHASSKSYSNAFEKYLKNSDNELYSLYTVDPVLPELLGQAKKNYNENIKTARALLESNNCVSTVPDEVCVNASKLLNSNFSGESLVNDRKVLCQHFKLSYADYCAALIYLLTGKNEKLDVGILHSYYAAKNLLETKLRK